MEDRLPGCLAIERIFLGAVLIMTRLDGLKATYATMIGELLLR